MQTTQQKRFEFHILSPVFDHAGFYLVDRETGVVYRKNEWPKFVVEMLCDDLRGFAMQMAFVEEGPETKKYAPRFGNWAIRLYAKRARSWARGEIGFFSRLLFGDGRPEIYLNRNAEGEAAYQAENDTSAARHAGFL